MLGLRALRFNSWSILNVPLYAYLNNVNANSVYINILYWSLSGSFAASLG